MENPTEETIKYSKVNITLWVVCLVIVVGIALFFLRLQNMGSKIIETQVSKIDPREIDADGNGVPDIEELYSIYEKVGQGFYLKSIEDPDKDRDGLEDKIIEPFVYGTDPEKTDTDGNGFFDGEDVYATYRNAFAANNETAIKKYEDSFANIEKEKTFIVGSLEERFNQRAAQTYNFYVGMPKELREKIKSALTLRLKGEYQKSLDMLNEELLLNPNSSMLKYHLGLTYHGMKDYRKALSIYESIVDDPNVKSPLLYGDLAAANYALGKGNKFVEYLELSIKNFPEDLSQYLKLADYYKETNRLDKEEATFNRGLKVEPRYAAFYNGLAIIAYSRGDMEKEIALYRKAAKYDFRDASAHFNLSVLLDQHKNDLKGALVESRIAMSLDPTNPKYMSRASVIYEKLGNKDKAIALENQVLKLSDGSADIFNELGLKYMEQDYKKAETYFRKAIQLDPKFPNAYNNLGIILSLTNRTDEAIASYKKAIELDARYANAYNNLGWLYANSGNIQEAITTLEKAILLNPNLPRPYGNLGNIYLQMGDRVKAKSYYNKAIERGSVDPVVIEGLKSLGQ